MPQNKNNLIWIDLEMTGLDPDNDRIIEIATVITDSDLNIIAEGPVIAINQSSEILDGMDDWNSKQHGKSGLIKRVQASKYTEEAAEKETLEFIKEYVPANCSPICGNSICQDRRFLYRYMKELENYFHYRNLDVSTIKILAQHWAPDVVKMIKKSSSHLAMDDIKDSINELIHYREHVFKI